MHSPEPVPRGRASKLLPVPEDSSLSDDNGDEEGESWDEASAFEGHAWWESDSEDEVRTSGANNMFPLIFSSRVYGRTLTAPPNKVQHSLTAVAISSSRTKQTLSVPCL